MSVTSLAGPLLIGYLVNCGLQGVLCVQTYTYYLAFPDDRCIFKTLVYGVFVLETVQTGLTAWDAFDTFVLGLGNANSLQQVRMLWFTYPIIGGFVAFIYQGFFAYRLKILSKSWLPTAPVMLFALCGMVAGMVTGAQALAASSLSELFVRRDYITSGLWNGSSAVCDIVIAVGMSYYLSRQFTYSTRSRFRTRISRLTRLIVETGILTATMATLNLLLFACLPRTSYFIVPSVIVAKLYSNTMLLILNNRITVIGGRDDTQINTSIQSEHNIQGRSRWSRRVDRRSRRREQAASSGNGIEVLTEVWSDSSRGDNLEVAYTSNSGK